MASYVKLRVYAKEEAIQDLACLPEFDAKSITKGDVEIKYEELFKALQSLNQEEKRSVIILGVPGSGKSITCLHLLEQIVNLQMYQTEFRFVFLIKFRDLNSYTHSVTFRELVLLYHGPTIPDKTMEDELWQYMTSNTEHIIFLLDGYDESEGLGTHFKKSNTIQFTSLDHPQHVNILLHNLIAGKIFPRARVLVTSRPQCTQQLRIYAHNNRIVKLEDMDVTQLEEMIKKNFPGKPLLSASLFQYITENEAING